MTLPFLFDTISHSQKGNVMNYTIYIYKKDNRCKNGERLILTIVKENYSGHAMMEIIPDYRKKYPASKGYRVDW